MRLVPRDAHIPRLSAKPHQAPAHVCLNFLYFIKGGPCGAACLLYASPTATAAPLYASPAQADRRPGSARRPGRRSAGRAQAEGAAVAAGRERKAGGPAEAAEMEI
ncbi:hypothetical protein A8926_0638 [Saccharopolyspora spinosa]|uniref:Uncharacterized protein n=1 Tax=Saccharopolyspora spinosa TaxID=60894 RepID=A0A2N3XR75_SACSN|nr:hypothetical protein A8926_0638 [Saccharopolyspora spinosa]